MSLPARLYGVTFKKTVNLITHSGRLSCLLQLDTIAYSMQCNELQLSSTHDGCKPMSLSHNTLNRLRGPHSLLYKWHGASGMCSWPLAPIQCRSLWNEWIWTAMSPYVFTTRCLISWFNTEAAFSFQRSDQFLCMMCSYLELRGRRCREVAGNLILTFLIRYY
jgi:hypothetical protein